MYISMSITIGYMLIYFSRIVFSSTRLAIECWDGEQEKYNKRMSLVFSIVNWNCMEIRWKRENMEMILMIYSIWVAFLCGFSLNLILYVHVHHFIRVRAVMQCTSSHTCIPSTNVCKSMHIMLCLFGAEIVCR